MIDKIMDESKANGRKLAGILELDRLSPNPPQPGCADYGPAPHSASAPPRLFSSSIGVAFE